MSQANQAAAAQATELKLPQFLITWASFFYPGIFLSVIWVALGPTPFNPKLIDFLGEVSFRFVIISAFAFFAKNIIAAAIIQARKATS